jgi:hypothetical protein
MAMDLTGINNENEFYTHHYLTAILEGDLKDIFKEWSRREKEEGIRPPYAELRSLTRTYFLAREAFERERDYGEKLSGQRGILEKFLSVLGYSYEPRMKDLPDGTALPVLVEVTGGNGAPRLWVVEVFDPSANGENPLNLSILQAQSFTSDFAMPDGPMENVISRDVFGLPEPP